MIDLYCERCGPGLLAEPLNAASNLSFFLAALVAWRLGKRLRALESGIGVLIGLAVCVGTGSTLFHTFATPWAQVLDIVPILLFQLVFVRLYLTRNVGIGSRIATVLVIGYLAICLGTLALPPYFNGSVIYLPTFVSLVGLAVYHAWSRQPGRWVLAGAVAIFGVALTCRTLDQALCPYMPLGTHYLWHLLNGGLLYLAMKALILKQADGVPSRPEAP